MNKSYRFFAVSFVALCACAPVVAAQNAPTFMSKYGEIQSVNKYSSNPFWSPDSPYNQRFPTPIYATGPDVNTGDCNRIVQNLITEYCASRGNCANARISDVRPHIMVSLSQLPGHNFATSCGGYIDTIFESYQKTYGNSSTGIVNIVPIQNKMAAPSIQIENPFKQIKSAAEIAMDARTAELENLQKKTTAPAMVTPAAFPKTIDDLSFTDRMANTSAGYEPYKDLKSYKTPKFETEDEYYERMKSVLEHSIHYVGAGAANTGCPTKYLTGRGATISCRPTIENGTCTAWCTDVSLTKCQNKYTIAPSENTDKTFYGKCTCNPGYVLNGNKCAKPGDPVNPDPTPDSMPDPVPPQNIPQCIRNIENDADFQNQLTSKLANISGGIDAFLTSNKSEFYNILGKQFVKHCLNGNTNILSEFNSFLNVIPETLPLTFGSISVSVQVSDLFDHIDFPTAVLVVNMRNLSPATTLAKTDISRSYFFNDSCSDHSVRFGSDGDTAINTAAQSVYPITERKGEFFLDYPVGKSNRAFPGLLLINASGWGGAENIVMNTDYLTAHKNIKKFAENLHDSACTSDGLAAYTVKLPISVSRKSSRGWWNWAICTFCLVIPKNMQNISDVKIMDGPYIIK